MITKDMVVGWMHEAFLTDHLWLAEYFATVAEKCRSVAMLPDDLPKAVKLTILQIKKSPYKPKDGDIKETLFYKLADVAFIDEIPVQAKAVPFPTRPSDAQERV